MSSAATELRVSLMGYLSSEWDSLRVSSSAVNSPGKQKHGQQFSRSVRAEEKD